MNSRLTIQTRLLTGWPRHFFFLMLFVSLALVSGRIYAGQNIEVSWDPDQTGTVTAYRLFYGTQSGVYTNSILFDAENDVIVSGLPGGHTYFFAVQASDQVGHISRLSNEASYVAPVIEPVVLQTQVVADIFGDPVLWITAEVIPADTWELDTSTDLHNWTPYWNDQGDSVSVTVPIGNEPKIFFRVQRQ